MPLQNWVVSIQTHIGFTAVEVIVVPNVVVACRGLEHVVAVEEAEPSAVVLKDLAHLDWPYVGASLK